MKTMIKTTTFAGLLVGTCLSVTANAQSVDYGTLEAIFGEPVTTSATGKPQRASEAPVAMEIITQEDIRRSGAKDIPQLLQKVMGVQVTRNAVGQADVSIRGYNSVYGNRVLTLVNGRQLLIDSFGYTSWGYLPIQLSEIRQIEVVKGPNSSLFGFNAESGVINIITYNPLHDDVGSATVKLGTQHYRELSAMETAKIGDKVGVRISGGVATSDGFNRDGFVGGRNGLGLLEGTEASDDAYMRRNVALDAEMQVTDNTSVRYQAAFANGVQDEVIPFMGSVGRSTLTKIQNHVTVKHQSNDYGLWSFDAYRNSDDTGLVQSDTHVIKLENLFKKGANHSFRLGGEYRYNSIKGQLFGSSTGGDGKFDYDLYALSGMWNWDLSSSTSLTNSVRYDYAQFGRDGVPTVGNFTTSPEPFDRLVEEFSFNTALTHKLSDSEKVRVSASRGLHIPSLIEMGSSYTDPVSGAIQFYGDPTIQTERILNFEIGYLKNLEKYNAELETNLFYQIVENVIMPNASEGAIPVVSTFANVGESKTLGWELGADGEIGDNITWGANYTLLSTEDEALNSASAQDALHFEGNTPKHQISLYGSYTKDKWEFNGELNYVSRVDYRAIQNTGVANADRVITEELEHYVVFNAHVGYNWDENTIIAVDGYNLIDNHREIARGYDTTFGDQGGNTIGRSVFLSLTRKF